MAEICRAGTALRTSVADEVREEQSMSGDYRGSPKQSDVRFGSKADIALGPLIPALPPKADIHWRERHVSVAAIADDGRLHPRVGKRRV
jgi:hypothetical protein